jgi:hypothetical protein
MTSDARPPGVSPPLHHRDFDVTTVGPPISARPPA